LPGSRERTDFEYSSLPQEMQGEFGLWSESNKKATMAEIRPTHFLAFAISERRPICQSELEPATDERLTVLVEDVTCSHCLRAISRLLANQRNRDVRDKSLHKNNKKGKVRGAR